MVRHHTPRSRGARSTRRGREHGQRPVQREQDQPGRINEGPSVAPGSCARVGLQASPRLGPGEVPRGGGGGQSVVAAVVTGLVGRVPLTGLRFADQAVLSRKRRARLRSRGASGGGAGGGKIGLGRRAGPASGSASRVVGPSGSPLNSGRFAAARSGGGDPS